MSIGVAFTCIGEAFESSEYCKFQIVIIIVILANLFLGISEALITIIIQTMTINLNGYHPTNVGNLYLTLMGSEAIFFVVCSYGY